MSTTVASAVLAPALAWAVISDLLYRRISNRLIAMLAVLWLLHGGWQLAHGQLQPAVLFTSIAIALGVMLVGYLLFVCGWMGGGDAKLMAVLCLWLQQQAPSFLVVSALAGGLLAIVLPLLRLLERSIGLCVIRLNVLLPRISIPLPHAMAATRPTGLPYAIAIAAGAAFVLWGTP
jgi:prepilin peptidase CpaA